MILVVDDEPDLLAVSSGCPVEDGHEVRTASSAAEGDSVGKTLNESERLFDEIVKAISLALDFDEQEKLYHSWRVGLMSYRIASRLGFPDRARLFYAGLLHDVGSIGLGHHVVHHARSGFADPAALDHAVRGARILCPFAVFSAMESAIATHHERLDGCGFPARRRGDEIPMGGAILRLADLVDIRLGLLEPARRHGAAVELARAERGTGVRSDVTDGFLEILSTEPATLEVLFDNEKLETAVRSLRPGLPELQEVPRSQLLGQFLWVFARIVDAKHSYTMGHSTRVAFYAHRIAQQLGDGVVSSWDTLCAGLLHDVGKVGVPRALLDKPVGLSDAEMTVVRKHASDSQVLIYTISDLAHLAYPAAAHHEKYEGGGYPGASFGDGIPLIGRILAYADIYDALTSERAYRRPLSHEEATVSMRRLVGSQLDPHLAEIGFDSLGASAAAVARPGQDLQGSLEFYRAGGVDPPGLLPADWTFPTVFRPYSRGEQG